ncbi:hypothetical protein GCM10020358_70750 [Amorphoplanes nipponensis]|uniref:DUF7144 domain-containing protein n=1 Tax=Actinoplanes nipponensis TaxID=135950 RepID=A0A919MJ65_9ACTN|nr:hypothetical protein [Actinoplanes nipponensis]GIE47136.1 hypothetical protein Ani05nite_06700 [Actinoplanes nipponensis]
MTDGHPPAGTEQERRDGAPAHLAPPAPLTARATAWLGWVLFISIIMLSAGLITIAQGLVALLDDDFYGASTTGLAVDVSYPAWGIALIGLGLALVAGAYGVLTGYRWGRTIGVLAAGLNALVNLGFVAAYPYWTVLVVAFDVIAIYALVVHGPEAKALRAGRAPR